MNSVNRKLTNEQVLAIRTKFRDGAKQKSIGLQFGVNQTCISGIITGKTYKDVGWPPSLSSGQDRRSLPEYPGYEFDADGNAYSYKYNKRYGKIMRLWPNHKGYLTVPLVTANGKHKNLRVNRIICLLFNGPPPTPEHQARHMNGAEADNRAVNLKWGTPRQNSLDKAKHGTNPVGEKVSSSKLTEDMVKAIRASNQSSRKLAVKYGVSQPAIVHIINRKTWKHI